MLCTLIHPAFHHLHCLLSPSHAPFLSLSRNANDSKLTCLDFAGLLAFPTRHLPIDIRI